MKDTGQIMMSDEDEDNFLQNLLNAVGDESYRLTGMTKINYAKLRSIFGWLTMLSFIVLAVSVTLGYGIDSVLAISVIKFARHVVIYSAPIFAVLFLIYIFLVKKSNYYNNAYNYVTGKIDELNLYRIDGQSKVSETIFNYLVYAKLIGKFKTGFAVLTRNTGLISRSNALIKIGNLTTTDYDTASKVKEIKLHYKKNCFEVLSDLRKTFRLDLLKEANEIVKKNTQVELLPKNYQSELLTNFVKNID